MPKLSDSQRAILAAAIERSDRNVFPVPGKLNGNAAGNVLKSLLKRKLIKETKAKSKDTVWRDDKKRGRLTLVATGGAVAAIGSSTEPSTKSSKASARAGTKQAQLIELLRRDKGATIDEMAKALSWQAHTVRGAIAGSLKKKLKLNVTSEKDEKRGRVYRIAG